MSTELSSAPFMNALNSRDWRNSKTPAHDSAQTHQAPPPEVSEVRSHGGWTPPGSSSPNGDVSQPEDADVPTPGTEAHSLSPSSPAP
ncbi:hypothetical protein AXF42_Ash013338 [Apostasia shenzhenica]|uniref:Uncharacterized protein n=1 Tax=Apostasia shenzhenica TaxID=1088818 RepID=A0A2I0BBP9_9ASPA|nr:hypothetical protein AXF42_Ash013338 [Apostasia shenzhenica]